MTRATDADSAAEINGAAVFIKEGSSSADQEDTNLPGQQAWVTEIGVDLNEKINFSVQAAPNRKDIPPKGNITFQMNPNVGLLGSFDKNWDWQSQLQLYFRY